MEIYFAPIEYRNLVTGKRLMWSHYTIAVIADSVEVAEMMIDRAIHQENLKEKHYQISRGEVQKSDYMIFASHEDWSTLYYNTFADS